MVWVEGKYPANVRHSNKQTNERGGRTVRKHDAFGVAKA